MFKRRGPVYSGGGRDDLFAWTVFIILLAGFAILSWIGSFYIFGHPEKGFSYRVLRAANKIDPPKRFELTRAPRGQFLDAEKLLERFGPMPPRLLAETNDTLLRNYLRNYTHTRDLVPYATGSYNVMGTFRLGPNNLFPTGVVALARSTDHPQLLLELVFPAEEKNIANLERMLLTGLDIKLARTVDLSAVLHARPLPDQRLLLTVVPLLYGEYTSTDAAGTFSLEPPEKLNVGAGLPVLNLAAVAEADKNYAAYLQRAGLADSAPALIRIEQPEVVSTPDVPVARAIPVTPTVHPAAATPTPAPPPATLDGVPVARAIPVTAATETPEPAEEPPTPAPIPDLPPDEGAAPDGLTFPPPEPPAAPAARDWAVYDAGRMPRGRLVDPAAARRLANQGATDEIQYLSGDFNVTASGPSRAVLRSRRQQNVRVIVDFPAGAQPPPEGSNVVRDAQRPFRITSVEQGADGIVNVYVREITRP